MPIFRGKIGLKLGLRVSIGISLRLKLYLGLRLFVGVGLSHPHPNLPFIYTVKAYTQEHPLTHDILYSLP